MKLWLKTKYANVSYLFHRMGLFIQPYALVLSDVELWELFADFKTICRSFPFYHFHWWIDPEFQRMMVSFKVFLRRRKAKGAPS